MTRRPDSSPRDPVSAAGILQNLFERAHVSIWACDADGMIVLWNPGAERLYGLTFAEAKAAPYWDLFVDEAERAAAVEDTAKIIDHGRRFENQLAFDATEDGTQRQMLTNCFRVVDPETGERFLAEIGVDIGDLALRQNEHRTLREVGVARLTMERNNLQVRLNSVAARIDEDTSECRDDYRTLRREWKTFAARPGASAQERLIAEAKLLQLETNWRQVRDLLRAIKNDLGACSGVEEVANLETRLDDLEPGRLMLEGLE